MAFLVLKEGKLEVALPSSPRKKMTKQLTGKRDDTALHSAARAGNIIAIKEIINDGGEGGELRAILSNQNSAGETGLYVAAEYGYFEVVREMIKHYDLVDAGIKARNGFDALHIAAKQGDLEVVKVLMEAHPELSMTVDIANTTALHSAATQGHTEVVNYFLESGSSLATIARSNGKTAIHSAARNGHVQVVRALLDKEPGIITRTDKKGQTALHMAVKGQNLEVVEELIAADPSIINMMLLSQKETDTKVVNRSNETAFDTAEKLGHSDITAILQEHGVLSAREIKPQSTNPARELKQTVSDIKHEVHYQLEHTRQTRKRVQGIAKRLNKMHTEGLNNAINSTTVVAVLIATVAFAAIFTVPGQYADDPTNIPPGLSLGEANIAPKISFLIFFVFDSIALFISLAVVVVQTSVVVIESKAKKQMMAIINKLMWLACVLVSVAYLALSFVVVGKQEEWLAIGVTIIGTTILATTLGTMCYWVIMHRIESSNMRSLRKNSQADRSKSWSVSVLSDSEKIPIYLLNLPNSETSIINHTMDEELLELQRQFEFAQQAKSSIRLSERNVVELVHKLHQLQIIDFDLLHTTSGKEYITPEQLRNEILIEINKKGRVSLIDLADTIGVDLYYVEKQSNDVVSNDASLMLINGEIISNFYWDTVSEEINERLQECSQISLAEIAAQLQVGSELLVSILEPRLGTLVKGRLEGGQLYTPAYVARVGAMVRGAARGIGVPMNLTALWSSLQVLLQDMDGFSGVVVESSFFQSLFNGLVKEGEILGSLRAGVHWTPSVFAMAQKECVDSFFSQNSFISYEALQKLGIPQPVQFLQSRYPEGKPLDTIFAHGSLIEMLDASVEDAIERGSWIDSLSILPTSFVPEDASKILSLCPSVQRALKSSKALVLGDSYIFSDAFVKGLFDRMEKELETLSVSSFSHEAVPEDLRPGKDTKHGRDDSSSLADADEVVNQIGSKSTSEKGSKRRKGKSAGNAKAVSAESVPEFQEPTATKSKKNQKKGKAIPASQVSDSKSGAKKDADRMDNPSFLSEESLIQKIISLIPDLEEQEYPETILAPLATYLRPMLLNSWMQKRKTAFSQNSQKMKQVLDNLQRKLDEAFLNIQLYEKALDLFEDDQSTAVLLHKHLLRTAASQMVDTLLVNLDMHNKLSQGIQVEESQNSEIVSLSSADRIATAKGLPGSLSKKAVVLVETLEGKRVESFISAVREVAVESGLDLKKLDKKLERTLLHSYRKELTSQVSAETDPVSLLPKVVSLLYVQVHGKALQAPGRAISVAVSRLKDKLDDSAFKTLADYQSAAVTLLSLISAGTGSEEDCTSDRILSKREFLEGRMPALKSLVLGSSQS
ncbi:hypothetical protein ACJIZ3_012605 [Penstemon smallii]|uniref:Ankyrin repeat-containing protein n=1 Tax=Penstemon smallii TaxID=265156 RepID=A0ABD3UQR8_9LAMI